MDTVDPKHKLIYKHKCTLEHTDFSHGSRIVDVAFNQDGAKLASSSVDGLVCIWDVENEALLHSLSCNGKPLAITWQQANGLEKLLCGLSTGELLLITIFENTHNGYEVESFKIHDRAVEFLSVQKETLQLASGAGKAVCIWGSLQEKDPFVSMFETVGPVQTEETVMTGLSWLNNQSDMIVVAYLHHEFFIIDTRKGEVIRRVYVPTLIGSFLLAVDDSYYIVHNLSDGFDQYELSSSLARLKFIQEGCSNVILRSAFANYHNAFLGGSSEGLVKIWGIDGGEAGVRIQTFPCKGVVQLVDAAVATGPDGPATIPRIAAAIEDPSPSVVVWEASYCESGFTAKP